MVYQSIERLLAPTPIQYNQAIGIAALGLLVNLVCAWLRKDGRDHHHHNHDGHEHHHDHHHDLNLRAAYLHVLADAATSVFAIVALFGGKLWGAVWLDPVMGLVGAALVSVWAYGLLRDTGRVLIDAEMDRPVVAEVREVVAELPVAADIDCALADERVLHAIATLRRLAETHREAVAELIASDLKQRDGLESIPADELSFEAVARLHEAGSQAGRLQDGPPDWRRAGLPLDGS